MITKEKKTIDISLDDLKVRPHERKRRRIRALIVLTAWLLVLAIIGGLVWGVVASNRRQKALAATSAEQAAQIAELQQQLADQQNAADKLQSENEQLKKDNQTLADENDAFKVEFSKMGLQFPPSAYEGKKLVAITFDDGPGQYTEELLDFLKENNARVTFFMLGSNATRYPDLIKRMNDEGHAIGNHSYSHPNLSKLSATAIASEMEKCNAAIRGAIGKNASVFRCPGGSNSATVQAAAKSANMPIIHWSLDTLDWQLKDKDKILTRTFEEIKVKDGDVILLHDIHRASVDAAKEMILRLKAEGYTFVTVPELLLVREGSITAGQVYSSAPLN